jgi:heme exporter protein D
VNWHSLADFADMGGYALYVWGAYAMAVGALAWEAVMLLQRRRRALQDLRERGIDRAAGAK